MPNEAVTENEEIKRWILKSLVPYLKPKALIATCSSSITITRLAARTDRPQEFIGMHFMNPVPPMQLVELIPGIATDDGTFEAVRELIGKLGKTAVKAEDFPAFIVNRILLPMTLCGAAAPETGGRPSHQTSSPPLRMFGSASMPSTLLLFPKSS
jgi:3-hydroxybutyryl-CoA dehydrogenase